MTDRYQALRDAIEAVPTPGPRSTKGPSRPGPEAPDGGDFAVTDRDGEIIAEAFRRVGRDEDAVRPAAANAALMAAADPDTIRALLGERDALREALEWYSAQAKRMGNAAIRQDSQAMLAMMKEIAVDYGGRARKALNPQVDTTGSQP